MRSTVLGIVIFLIASDFTFAQRKFFIGTNDDYTILGDQGITIKHGERDGSYVDYYVLRENESFVFMLTISKVHSAQPIDADLIYSDSFKKSISNECSCDILDSNRASFNNFNGIEFLFKTQQSGRSLSVVSMSTVVQEFYSM